MSRDIIAEVMESSKGRMIGDGIPAADLDTILERCSGWDDWYPVLTGIGDEYEQLADERLAAGARITAGEMLWRASMFSHYAQFYLFDQPALREAGQRQKVERYARGAPLFFPPAERVDVRHEGFTIPGYLRLPPGVDRPPCVLLLGGLESTKEESFLFERMCHDRGLATFAFDGPGQGEMFFQTPMRPDFERFTSAVLDYLETRPEIDSGRFGILGRSLGGHYAAKSAAHDPRIAVCVCWSALYEIQTYWWDLHDITRNGFTYCAGETDPARGKERLRFIDLAGWADKITASLYIQHGMLDDLIPFSQAERLEREAVNAREIVTHYVPDGIHCCHNHAHRTRQPMADFLALRLKAEG